MSITRIADAFWPHAPNSEVADLLIGKARWFSQRTDAHPSPVTRPTAERLYKGDLHRVLAVAGNPGTDPAVLAKYAKDTRVSVRHSLLANPATPTPELISLTLWAAERGDNETADGCANMPLTAVIELGERMHAAMKPHSIRAVNLGARDLAIRCTESPELATKLAAIGNDPLTAELGLLAHTGEIQGVSLSDIVAADPDGTRSTLLWVLDDRTLLTMELARLWREHTEGADHYANSHMGYTRKRFTNVEPGAADMLIGGTLGQNMTGILNGACEQTIIERSQLMGEKLLRDSIELLEQRDLGQDCETALVTRYVGLKTSKGIHGMKSRDVLALLRHELPEDLLLGLLRCGGPASTAWWLANVNRPWGPRPGLMTKLVAQPGGALNRGLKPDDSEYKQVLTAFTQACAQNPGLSPELIAMHDEYVGTNLHNSSVAAAVAPILTERFAGKEQRALWETFLTLGADWSDTFTALVETTLTLNGVEATAVQATETGNPADTESDQPQLALW